MSKFFKSAEKDSFDRISDHIELHNSLPRYRALIFRRPDTCERRLMIIRFDERVSAEFDASYLCPAGWLFEDSYDLKYFTYHDHF